jgi:CRISPR/Cas system-associated exonuclease Cas4 (RecB family)
MSLNVIDLIEHAPDNYEAERDERPGDELSPSQLTTYMECPARWAFRKVWGIDEPGTVASAMGRAVHEATGHAHNVQIASGAILPAEHAVDVFRASWREESKAVQFTARHDPDELRERGSALVAKYMAEVAPFIDPAGAEVKLPAGAEIGGVRVRGRLDLIESNGRIRDTKTICRKPGGMLTAHRVQLTIYAMAMPGASGAIAVDYLVKTKNKPQLVTIEDRITHSDELLATTLLQSAQKGMRSGVYLPNRCADSCNRLMCGFADLCESEYGGRVPFYPEAS